MIHGANIYKYAKIVQCTPEEIVDFSSNINFVAPDIQREIPQEIISRYPDPKYKELKNTIAQNYALSAKEIALYNGATTAIHTLFSRLKKKEVYLYAPLYSEYEKAAIETKKNIYKINRIEDIDTEVEKKSIVVFVNPSTPEGSYYELEELFAQWMEKKCTIILDESFIEFEALKSYREKIKTYKKLYIIQSFSKFYAAAGVRIGAIFSHPSNIKKLSTPLWNISALDSFILEQSLKDSEFKQLARQKHAEQKTQLQNILKDSGLFEQIVASEANFILVKSHRANEIFNHLLEHKILVRPCWSFDFLDHSYLRFAVKNNDAHQALKNALATLTPHQAES